MNALDSTSTRPYLIRALYEWCTDNGLTPYVAVAVDDSVQVPREYVKNDEIVLNISYDATSALTLGNDFIAFKARFAGTAREIMVPIARVIAIYARENGQGMAFPLGQPGAAAAVGGAVPAPDVAPAPHAAELRAVPPAPRMQAVPDNRAADEAMPAKVVPLVPPTAAGAPDDSHGGPGAEGHGEGEGEGEGGGDEPPRPGAGAGAPRPALKRIK